MASVAWEKRIIKAKSGKSTKLVELKPFQVYSPINRIHHETSVSVGQCHKIITNFVTQGIIEKYQIQMHGAVKAPFIIEIIDPFCRALVKSIHDIYKSSVIL